MCTALAGGPQVAETRLVQHQPESQTEQLSFRDRDPGRAVVGRTGQRDMERAGVERPCRQELELWHRAYDYGIDRRNPKATPQWNEPAGRQSPAFQMVVEALERHQCVERGRNGFQRSKAHRRYQAARGPKLLPPGWGQLMRPHGRDDAIIGSELGMTQCAIDADHLDAFVTGRSQMRPRRRDDVFVDVDRHHLALLAHHVGQEGRVVPGAGTDFQDALRRADIELLQHDGHDRWLRRGAEAAPLDHLCHDVRVAVHGLER